MYLLTINMTASQCSLALARQSTIMASSQNNMAGAQAERLIEEVEILLRDAGCSYDDLNYIAINIGPGGFTALRVGLAAVKGMALHLDATLLAVTAFELTAFAAAAKGGLNSDFMVVLDARREQSFVQYLNAAFKLLSEPFLCPCQELICDRPAIIAGTIDHALAAKLEKQYHVLSVLPEVTVTPQHMVDYVLLRLKNGNTFYDPVPLYVRPPDAVKMVERKG